MSKEYDAEFVTEGELVTDVAAPPVYGWFATGRQVLGNGDTLRFRLTITEGVLEVSDVERILEGECAETAKHPLLPSSDGPL